MALRRCSVVGGSSSESLSMQVSAWQAKQAHMLEDVHECSNNLHFQALNKSRL